MVLCAAYCDKEATLDFLAMEVKPSGRYIGKSVNVQNQHAVDKGKQLTLKSLLNFQIAAEE